ncbi:MULTISPECIES: hypothetical protein [unclassified Kitasatospora]|uniref:hypothetical protein n=1 Tax=unclassified Kitasatospora TaxID=2633591 RepID=UPI0033D2F3CC
MTQAVFAANGLSARRAVLLAAGALLALGFAAVTTGEDAPPASARLVADVGWNTVEPSAPQIN